MKIQKNLFVSYTNNFVLQIPKYVQKKRQEFKISSRSVLRTEVLQFSAKPYVPDTTRFVRWCWRCRPLQWRKESTKLHLLQFRMCPEQKRKTKKCSILINSQCLSVLPSQMWRRLRLTRYFWESFWLNEWHSYQSPSKCNPSTKLLRMHN